eukprot:710687-Hanusia_phi.AAC.1
MAASSSHRRHPLSSPCGSAPPGVQAGARDDDASDLLNLTVLISLEAKNAFNSLSRQAIFDTLSG